MQAFIYAGPAVNFFARGPAYVDTASAESRQCANSAGNGIAAGNAHDLIAGLASFVDDDGFRSCPAAAMTGCGTAPYGASAR